MPADCCNRPPGISFGCLASPHCPSCIPIPNHTWEISTICTSSSDKTWYVLTGVRQSSETQVGAAETSPGPADLSSSSEDKASRFKHGDGDLMRPDQQPGAGDSGESVVTTHGRCGRPGRSPESANFGRAKSIRTWIILPSNRWGRTATVAIDEQVTAAGWLDFQTCEPDRRDTLGREETSGARSLVSKRCPQHPCCNLPSASTVTPP